MPDPLIALVLDSALDSCSVAIGDEQRLRAAVYRQGPGIQAELIVPMIEDVLRQAHLTPDALTRIGVTIGPGSFTGTRIGLATARAFALVRKLPVIGVTTLEALAQSAPRDRPVLVAFDARRGQLYLQLFGPADLRGDRACLSEPLTLALAQVPGVFPQLPRCLTLIGSGGVALSSVLPQGEHVDAPFPVAEHFLPLITRRPAPASSPRPLYLRPPNAKPFWETAS